MNVNTQKMFDPKHNKLLGYVLCGLMASPIVTFAASDIYTSYIDAQEAPASQYGEILHNLENTKQKPYADEYRLTVNHALKDNTLTTAEYKFLSNYYHLLTKAELIKTN